MKEIIDAISRAAVRIKRAIEFSDTGYSEHVNKTGDTQLKLDIASDLIIEEEFGKVSSIKSIIS
ncbi:MAG: fructose-bisphosphatase class I, partial [Campylobacteraceae bacterium]|nr:fructose-bisphosphatase class I [Campylobacteraceae bacterium]MDR0666495.1 fructose-bisphosphatase class I [Campylobacteraceae bacterium]